MQDEQKINHLAVVVAAIAHFVLGAAWFTGFAARWTAGLRMSAEEVAYAKTHMSPLPYAVAFLCNLLIAYGLAWVITHTGQRNVFRGIAVGFGVGLTIAAAAMVTELGFELKGPMFIAISAGYPLVGMTLMGGVIGAWKGKASQPLSSAAGVAK